MANGTTPNGYVRRPFHPHDTRTHTFWYASDAIVFLSRRDATAPFSLYLSLPAGASSADE